MDLGFFTEMLGGKGANPLTMLLPLLLGGKSPDLSALMKLFSQRNDHGQSENSDQNADYPPLFGSGTSSIDADKGDIMQVLGKMIPQKPKESEPQKQTEEYPYELQYNRPFKK